MRINSDVPMQVAYPEAQSCLQEIEAEAKIRAESCKQEVEESKKRVAQFKAQLGKRHRKCH